MADPVSVRIDDQERARIEAVRRTLDASSFAGAITSLMNDGLLLREAALVAAGGAIPGAFTETEFLTLLAQRVLPLMPILQQAGLLLSEGISLPSAGSRRDGVSPSTIDGGAADDLRGLGTDLL